MDPDTFSFSQDYKLDKTGPNTPTFRPISRTHEKKRMRESLEPCLTRFLESTVAFHFSFIPHPTLSYVNEAPTESARETAVTVRRDWNLISCRLLICSASNYLNRRIETWRETACQEVGLNNVTPTIWHGKDM